MRLGKKKLPEEIAILHWKVQTLAPPANHSTQQLGLGLLILKLM